MSKTYCGAKSVPPGKKRGTVQECRKQWRAYGVEAIPTDILNSVPVKIITQNDIIMKQIKIRSLVVKIKKTEEEIDRLKNLLSRKGKWVHTQDYKGREKIDTKRAAEIEEGIKKHERALIRDRKKLDAERILLKDMTDKFNSQ